MKPEELHLIIPGPLEQRTGGYLYDARMVSGLERLGWTVVVHSLRGEFPSADETAQDTLHRALASLMDGTRVIIDGLAMGALPKPIRDHAPRLKLLALVHHPLADETGLDPEKRELFERLESEALAACSGVVCTSAYTAGRMEAFGVPPTRVRSVPPGTEPARPAAGPGAGAAPRLLCVGTVVPRKGQDVLVKALARLKHVKWSCVCAGSVERAPDYARSVMALVQEHGLADRISFPGELGAQALDELYHHASLFVLPSHYEGYGMALAEALARGLPVVSTTGGAIPHTVPSDAAILVPPGDEASLSGALGHLLAGTTGNARRAKLATAARTHALTLPTWERAVASFARAIWDLSPSE